MLKNDQQSKVRYLPAGGQAAFALAGVPSGVIYNGISYFLLIYYSQVLGLDPSMTGMALGLALLIDALSDPVIGFLSDNTQSRMGRRHPYLYASAPLIAVLFYLIWNPPSGASEAQLFAYLLVVIIALRISITLFEVPSYAMVPELVSDYDQRTNILNSRVSVSWIAGGLMAIAMYSFFLTPTAEDVTGLMDVDGYRLAGLVGAVLIFMAIVGSSLLLHRYVLQSAASSYEGGMALRDFYLQMRSVLKSASLRALILSGVFSYIGYGTSTAMWVYVYGYFWEFSNDQTSLILAANTVGALLAFGILPAYARKREKRSVAITMSIVALLVSALPILSRFAGLMPDNGSDGLFMLMLLHGVVQVAFIVMISSVIYSMSADIVEETAQFDGYQSEGIILSTQTFITKFGQAGGVALAGFLLSLISFPTGQGAAAMPQPETIANLGWVYVAAVLVFYGLSVICLFGYKLVRPSAAVQVAAGEQLEAAE